MKRRIEWGHQYKEKEEGLIMILFQNMGGLGNELTEPIRHEIDQLNKYYTMGRFISKVQWK